MTLEMQEKTGHIIEKRLSCGTEATKRNKDKLKEDEKDGIQTTTQRVLCGPVIAFSLNQ